MATMLGLVEHARAYLPEFVGRRRTLRSVPDTLDTRPELVAELIERQVIPRLLVVHRHDAPSVVDAGPATEITREEAEAFAPLALETGADVLLDHVEQFVHRGVPIETILVDLLAPAARALGVFWEDDRCDFVDVTMGLWRLQEVVREVSARMPCDCEAQGNAALFATVPGEQHSFGTVIVDEVFRRGGWATTLLSDPTTSELLDELAGRMYDVIGLTVSCDDHIGRLGSLILAVRSVSRNPRICVMLGGRVLAADPEISTRAGADGTASDAPGALAMAERLVTVSGRREFA